MGYSAQWREKKRASEKARELSLAGKYFPFACWKTGTIKSIQKEVRRIFTPDLLISNGVPGVSRTRGLLLRRQSLYPSELRGHE